MFKGQTAGGKFVRGRWSVGVRMMCPARQSLRAGSVLIFSLDSRAAEIAFWRPKISQLWSSSLRHAFWANGLEYGPFGQKLALFPGPQYLLIFLM